MLLSICIPTRNRASFLETTIETWREELGQAGIAAEILIGDNASTDRTPQLLAAYTGAATIPVRGESHAQNLGMTRNLNSVFTRARGEYIWIWGDDDLPIRGTVSMVADLLRQHAPEVTLVNTDNIQSQDDANRRYVITDQNRLRAPDETPLFARTPAEIESTFRHLSDWAYLTNLLSAVIVRRESFLSQLAASRLLLDDENVYQFQHPILMLAATAGRTLIITRTVCLHRKNTTSWSGSADLSIPCFIDSARVIGAVGGAFSPALLGAYSRRMARQCLGLMAVAREDGQHWSAANEEAFCAAYRRVRFCGISVESWVYLLNRLPVGSWRLLFFRAGRLQRLADKWSRFPSRG